MVKLGLVWRYLWYRWHAVERSKLGLSKLKRRSDSSDKLSASYPSQKANESSLPRWYHNACIHIRCLFVLISHKTIIIRRDAKQVIAGSGGGGEGRHVWPGARLHRRMGKIQGKREISHSWIDAWISPNTVLGIPEAYRERFLGNTSWVASLAMAVHISAGWLGHEASSISKHTKTLPTTCWDA